MSVLAASLLALTLASLAACTDSNAGTDLGVVEPGCRAPSACYKTGVDCACNRDDVNTAACRDCDPEVSGTCYCAFDMGVQCLEPAQVCVGRGSVCAGVGARCLAVGATSASCAASGGGDPPMLVGRGLNGALEPHCAFVDDVCCPGTANPDAGNIDPDAGI